MTNNIPNFDIRVFEKYTELYKISTQTSLTEEDVDKILKAGFIYDAPTNSFLSNLQIVNKQYNLKIKYHDSNYRLFVKNENENYSEKTKNFPAKKTATITNGNTTIYKFNIDLMFISLHEWVKNIEFTTIKNILTSKIGENKTIEVDYKTDKFEITKISKSYLYVKASDGSSKTYDINMTNINTEDLSEIDKKIELAIKEAEAVKNKSFKHFVQEQKNDIHNIHTLNE